MKAVLLLSTFALIGCASFMAAEIGPTAALGQIAETNGLRVRPVQIIEDSRCPTDVQCVWAGRVRLLTEIELRGGSELLKTTLTLGEPAQVADGALTLVAVAPQKTAKSGTEPGAYRFTFDFQGGL